MLTSANADVAGASAPECSTSDKARVQAGLVEGQSKEQSRHSRAHGAVHQEQEVMAAIPCEQAGNIAKNTSSTGDIATHEARRLSITSALRRIGYAPLARDDGVWIVRSWRGPTPAMAYASEWQSTR